MSTRVAGVKHYSIFAGGAEGAPMNEATLCEKHLRSGADECEVAAANAEDFTDLEWRDSTANVARDEVGCVECRMWASIARGPDDPA